MRACGAANCSDARETAELSARVVDHTSRLTTIVGSGGIGKTSLALCVSDANRSAFAHGTVFVELASVKAADLVIPAVCQALGIEDAGDRPLDESLQAYLRDKQVLVVAS
jgi:predicted ATPase